MCPEGQILNPKTNRCVSLTGKIGKDVVESKTCPDGQILIPKTNR